MFAIGNLPESSFTMAGKQFLYSLHTMNTIACTICLAETNDTWTLLQFNLPYLYYHFVAGSWSLQGKNTFQ